MGGGQGACPWSSSLCFLVIRDHVCCHHSATSAVADTATATPLALRMEGVPRDTSQPPPPGLPLSPLSLSPNPRIPGDSRVSATSRPPCGLSAACPVPVPLSLLGLCSCRLSEVLPRLHFVSCNGLSTVLAKKTPWPCTRGLPALAPPQLLLYLHAQPRALWAP